MFATMDFLTPSMSPIYLFLLVGLKAYELYQQHKKDNPKIDPLTDLKAEIFKVLAALTGGAALPAPGGTPALPAAPASPGVIQANVPVSFSVTPSVAPVPTSGK